MQRNLLIVSLALSICRFQVCLDRASFNETAVVQAFRPVRLIKSFMPNAF